MVTIERMIQQVRPDKWAELEKINKKYNIVESRLGFPPKKRYQCLTGSHDSNTLIIERQWDSLAAMEATYEKTFADPEHQALVKESTSIIKSEQWELYMPLP
ncbi:MAG TPA: NIPSNAP family protein [Anaerolineales bacterium]